MSRRRTGWRVLAAVGVGAAGLSWAATGLTAVGAASIGTPTPTVTATATATPAPSITLKPSAGPPGSQVDVAWAEFPDCCATLYWERWANKTWYAERSSGHLTVMTPPDAPPGPIQL